MSVNPLKDQLKALTATVSSLHDRRDAIAADLSWFAGFDQSQAEHSVDERTQTLDQLVDERAALILEQKRQTARTAALVSAAQLGWNPARWFSAARSQAGDALREHRQILDELRKKRAAMSRSISRLEGSLEADRSELAKYRAFDRAAAEAELATIDSDIPLRELEREQLAVRKKEIDRRLKAPRKELHAVHKERDTLTADVTRLEYRARTLAEEIREAEGIAEQLSRAGSGYDRAMLHKECERRFDDGSPGAVIRARREQVGKIRRELDSTRRQLAAVERSVVKLEKRIEHIGELGARDVRGLVVDGNNLCYEGQEFIGLAAVEALCGRLAHRYVVTVVFDASIRQRLGSVDAVVRRELAGTKVHVVASRTGADETILDTAQDTYVWVLSNDRFREYPDKPAVAAGRLIRHEILNGRIFVHDLGVDEPFATSARP